MKIYRPTVLTMVMMIMPLMVGAGLISTRLEPVSDSGEFGLQQRAVQPEDSAPVTDDWVLIVAAVGLWVVGNALWASPKGTFLGSLRELAHRTSVEHLYLGLPFATGGANRRGYLEALTTHRARMYVDEAVAKGTGVDLDVEALPDYPRPAPPLHGHVRDCEPVADGWYLAAVDLDPKDPGDTSRLREFIEALRRQGVPEPQT